MDETTRSNIRKIFLSSRPSCALMTAALLLGIPLKELKREIEEGAIVAVSSGMGLRLTREEMMAAAMRVWEQGVIEAALGDEAASVLPEAIRLVDLRARVPRYQREMLRSLAQHRGTSVDDVLTRELEDVACAYAEELKMPVPDWPGLSADYADEKCRERASRRDGGVPLGVALDSSSIFICVHLRHLRINR
jgi:hypothetical protein